MSRSESLRDTSANGFPGIWDSIDRHDGGFSRYAHLPHERKDVARASNLCFADK